MTEAKKLYIINSQFKVILWGGVKFLTKQQLQPIFARKRAKIGIFMPFFRAGKSKAAIFGAQIGA
ncbi:MAG: hypothetical protein K2N22_00345 [Clostridia bacterium]|nr:hypothetical protein [Clostridia bacterium]